MRLELIRAALTGSDPVRAALAGLIIMASNELDTPDMWVHSRSAWDDAIANAEQALADEPAVPQGREPAAVTGQPSDEELALIYHDCCRGCEFMDQGGFEDAARAVLARWGNPAPAPPADGEVAELVRTLTGIAHWRRRGRPGEGDPSPFDIRQADRLDRAAELLERQVPVPVSERLPGPKDCDAEGRCWWGTPSFVNRFVNRSSVTQSAQWRLSAPDDRFGSELFWCPAHALPLPEVGE